MAMTQLCAFFFAENRLDERCGDVKPTASFKPSKGINFH